MEQQNKTGQRQLPLFEGDTRTLADIAVEGKVGYGTAAVISFCEARKLKSVIKDDAATKRVLDLLAL